MTVPAVILRELNATRPLMDFSNVQPSDHLFDDLEFDELDRVAVGIGLEEALHIELPDHVIERWQTVEDIIASVRTSLPTVPA